MEFPETFRVYHEVGDTDLALTAGPQESFLVIGVRVANPATDYVTLRCEQMTIGYFRVGGAQGNHLYFPSHSAHRRNLLGMMIDRGLHSGYPVAEGETLEITGAAQSGAVQEVLYVVGDAGTFRPDAVNGSRSKEFEFVNYGQPSSAPDDGANTYDAPQAPAEFPDFPFGATAPENRSVELLGMAMSDVGNTTSSQSNQQRTTFLQAIQERTVLWDEERDGLLCRGEVSTGADEKNVASGQNTLGNLSSVDLSRPFLFGTAPKFTGGDELQLSVITSVEAGSANLAAADVELALIERVTSGGGSY